MSNNTKFLWGFVLGAAAGAALGILLTSDKGKEILDEFRDAIDKGRKVAQDITEEIKDFVQTT